MTDFSNVTDNDIASDIKLLVAQLNDHLKEAAKREMIVSINSVDVTSIEDIIQRNIVTVTVSKEL